MPPSAAPAKFARSSVFSRALSWGARVLDIRSGEGSAVVLSFVVLLLVISAHTMLETARDTLLLARMPRRSLGIVYILIAICTLPTGALASRMTARWGPKRSLSGSLVVAAVSVLFVRTLPPTPTTAMGLYVLTGIIGSILVPQFWAFAAGLFTVSQGRRLLGPIASAGVIGGFVGSGLAALAVQTFSTRQLLIGASVIFVLAAGRVLTTRVGDEVVIKARQQTGRSKREKMFSRDAMKDINQDPFLRRIALLVVLSTATVLALDYLFKWSVAESVPPERLGPYLARYYALLNGASLVMQLFVGGALVRRLGVTSAVLVTPFLLTSASVLTAVFGGAHRAILATRGLDGALRHSVHRITTELLYLPVNSDVRARIKPFIDGALARIAQAVTACVLLAMAESGHLKRNRMIVMVIVLAVAWLVLAVSTRKPYLAVFRKALTRDSGFDQSGGHALDFATVAMLVERLSNPNPEEVVAALHVLKTRGQVRLVPALILYHPSPRVLTYAIELFSSSERLDWMPLAEPLVSHDDQEVRMAALRSLCRRGRVDLLEKIAETDEPRIRGYVCLWLAVRQAEESGAKKRVLSMMETFREEDAIAVREGMLAAIADAPQRPDLGEMLVRFLEVDDIDQGLTPERLNAQVTHVDLLSLAAAAQLEPRSIPLLIGRLGFRVGRDSIREALVKFGKPAFDALVTALDEPTSPRQVRVHIPRTLARFGNREAAELLLSRIENEKDGLVRYKAIRGLGGLVNEFRIKTDVPKVERFAKDNLQKYLELMALRTALSAQEFNPALAVDERRARATQRFLEGLLDDKMRQALERAFRLLKIAYPREDIRGVHNAALSSDKRARANAGEFLDTLLTKRSERELRALLRLVTDDLEADERVRRAAPFFATPAPEGHTVAIVALARDPDTVLSTIAVDHARAVGEKDLLDAVRAARASRPASPTRASVARLALATGGADA